MRKAVSRWRDSLRARGAAWVLRRQGEDRLPLELTRRRIYVLPTRAGLGFGVLLLAMLLAGLNYANSLALMLTFTLAAFAVVAMNHCHRNLQGLRVLAAHGAPAFAGGHSLLAFTLANPARLARHALRFEATGATAELPSIDGEGSARVELPLPAASRGVRQLDRVRLCTDFPFGLVRAWTWLHLPLEIVVYPAPLGSRAPPLQGEGRESGARTTQTGRDEWRDLRPFRDGDSPRQVAWKAYARGLPLLVKEYGGSTGDILELDYSRLEDPDPEARLSQLCRWIIDAEAAGASYALRLPGGVAFPASRGAAHRLRCLESLARFGAASGAAR